MRKGGLRRCRRGGGLEWKGGMAVRYVLMALGIFFGDLWMKNKIEGMEEPEQGDLSRPCCARHGLIMIRRHRNRGAILNLGESRSRAVTAAALMMTGALTILFVLSLGQKGKGLLKAGLSMLLGGAFSNAYDRLKRGYVVDYFSLDLKWEPLRRVVFNLSDFCIMIGAMLVAVGM